jgi:peptidoglycan/xylan/chitin deacetylase (PgdA/CDA1 family)
MNTLHAPRPEGYLFLLRIDCEHPEAIRWAGSEEIEAVGLRRLLDLLDTLAVPATFAFVGATALRFAGLTQACLAGGHAIAGHSMHHAGRYAGRPEEWQRTDMEQMVAAVEHACRVRVRGLAAPDHGVVDEATLRAAAAVGLEYVLNLTIKAPSGEALGPVPGGPGGVYVPSAHLRFVWDWTALQPESEPFSVAAARRQWDAAIYAASREGGAVSLIIHPWIVESNQEYDLLATTLQRVRQGGGRFSTFDQIMPDRHAQGSDDTTVTA